MQKLVLLVNIPVITEIVDVVNVVRGKYLLKCMSVGGNNKLDIKAVLGARVEGGISFPLIDITVEIIALKQFGVRHTSVCVFEIIILIGKFQFIAIFVPDFFEIERIDKRNQGLG